MRKTFSLLVLVSVLLVHPFPSKAQQLGADLEGNISLSGAFALYPLAVKWADEFKKLHPKVRIDVSAGGAGKGMTDALAKVVDLGMLSREVHPDEFKKGIIAYAVAKDAVIATINAKNPKVKELLAKGYTQPTGEKIFITGQVTTWGQVLGENSNIPIHVYTRSDACGAAETWANFFGKKQENLKGTAVFGDPGIASAVAKDPLGFGYNNIAFAYDQKTKRPVAGVTILPLDINKNGKIDPQENFYSNINLLIRAIAGGKYPAPPSRTLYLVSNGKPKPAVEEFIKFILTQGQKYNNSVGFIQLNQTTLKANLNKLK
ncbi:MAG: substrate-binding domain-containing protein [Dysgonamonadaceae bacterium]